MREILTRKNEVILVDDDDYEKLSKFTWYISKGGKNHGGYGYAISSQRNESTGKQYKLSMHREIMNAKKGEIVDHINGNKLDNRKENLRIVTPYQNSLNVKKKDGASSQYKGVAFSKDMNLWKSSIRVKGKGVHIGYFSNEVACALAYNEYAIKHFGEYAKINNIDSDINWRDYLYERKISSKQKGVHFSKSCNKWVARINVDKKRIELGSFDTEGEAIEVRLKAEERLLSRN